jgi:hypothetical protein
MQTLVIIVGAPAVGKMRVGQELAAYTGLKLFHNHLSLEVTNPFFDFGTKPFYELDKKIRTHFNFDRPNFLLST